MKRLVLAVALLLLFGGCAAMKKGTVPTSGVKGMLGDVCGVARECARVSAIPAVPAACDTAIPTSLVNEFNANTTVNAVWMGTQVTPLCSAIDTCMANRTDLAEYLKTDYVRWCDWLEKLAAAGAVN